ncbi:prevent-host-death family protein [Pararhizobium capsulatum DSM 1112]|uniref:Antitoxin n=1 Tax=Pararhizobium capsulatum DSM 1112 TaxID=1121113 RepID=A0ABU0C296_9HYPH|nr:type II toxin-antitoxin system prevent-host-death family antitoxin [Pararhizobium capsulatum]MDQ0324036.1 prevent-host-death family protein [Pararhizobium capsulatum DSM 1112]
MTTTVKISEAKTHLSELLARVEAGEDLIITRGNDPVAHVTRIRKQTDMQLLLAEVRAARLKGASSTHEELLTWRDEGRR